MRWNNARKREQGGGGAAAAPTAEPATGELWATLPTADGGAGVAAFGCASSRWARRSPPRRCCVVVWRSNRAGS